MPLVTTFTVELADAGKERDRKRGGEVRERLLSLVSFPLRG